MNDLGVENELTILDVAAFPRVDSSAPTTALVSLPAVSSVFSTSGVALFFAAEITGENAMPLDPPAIDGGLNEKSS